MKHILLVNSHKIMYSIFLTRSFFYPGKFSNASRSDFCCFLYQKGQTCHFTVKILKIGTPEIITIIVLQLEQLDFTVQYCVQKMQTE